MQQFNFKKGLKKFGEKGKVSAVKEIKTQHAWKYFEPIVIAKLMWQEKERAEQTLMYLAKKKDGMIKGQKVVKP